MANLDSEGVRHWLEHLRTRSGEEICRLRKDMHTDNPSVQGVWTPATNRPTQHNVTKFPNTELSEAANFEESATERLLKKAKELRNA